MATEHSKLFVLLFRWQLHFGLSRLSHGFVYKGFKNLILVLIYMLVMFMVILPRLCIDYLYYQVLDFLFYIRYVHDQQTVEQICVRSVQQCALN